MGGVVRTVVLEPEVEAGLLRIGDVRGNTWVAYVVPVIEVHVVAGHLRHLAHKLVVEAPSKNRILGNQGDPPATPRPRPQGGVVAIASVRNQIGREGSDSRHDIVEAAAGRIVRNDSPDLDPDLGKSGRQNLAGTGSKLARLVNDHD